MDEEAVSTVVGIILLIGIVAVVGALAAVIIEVPESRETRIVAAQASIQDGDTWISNHGPDDLQMDKLSIIVEDQDQETSYAGTDLGSSLPDPTVWRVGDKICISGLAAGCPAVHYGQLAMTGIYENQVIFELQGAMYSPIELTSEGVRSRCAMDWELHIVGVEITYGKGGPDIPVYAHASTDGGDSYWPLFTGNPVQAGQKHLFGTLPEGSQIATWGIADLPGRFTAEYGSTDNDPHVLTLLDGDPVPIHPGYGSQVPVGDILAPYEADGLIDIGPNEVMILFEFTSNLSSSAADFQDLVVIYRAERAAC